MKYLGSQAIRPLRSKYNPPHNVHFGKWNFNIARSSVEYIDKNGKCLLFLQVQKRLGSKSESMFLFFIYF